VEDYMKKFFVVFSVLVLGFFINCGDKEESKKEVPAQVIEANTIVSEEIDKILSSVPSFPAAFNSVSYASVKSKIGINKTIQNVAFYDTGDAATAKYKVTWSYNDDATANPKVYTYSFTFLKDYTVTLTNGGTFTFKAGGTESYTLNMYNNNTGTYTTTANYPYSYNGDHTIGWTFNGTESDTASSVSGSITYDGTTYTFEE
jgi:hypothetical protein